MPTELDTALDYIRSYKEANPAAKKAQVQAAFVEQFEPDRVRSVFVGNGYALRFAEARTNAFSNTVLSLSALRTHDTAPFIVVVVRTDRIDFLLANATLLRKISHSSHELRTDNIKGSFNGTDILTDYEDIANVPANFEQLFAMHSAFSWNENVERLVEATNEIVGRDSRFHPTAVQNLTILEAPARALAAIQSPAFAATQEELRSIVAQRRAAILEAAQLENVNLRGNAIEFLLTGSANDHALGDLTRELTGVGKLGIDIKTKLMNKASAPKAYNIDKMLAYLAEPGSVFAFLIVVVDVEAGLVTERLLPVLETAVLDATVVQHHWAGRGSRGVTQLAGRIGRAIDPQHSLTIDLNRSSAFLQELLSL